jgi:hypothetical protein
MKIHAVIPQEAREPIKALRNSKDSYGSCALESYKLYIENVSMGPLERETSQNVSYYYRNAKYFADKVGITLPRFH